MAVSVSLINMKGGVGKTTIASQMAHAADQDNLKVLAVDLDPQSNLSQSIMGIEAYADHLADNRLTIAQIFDDYIPAGPDYGSPRPIDLDEVIVRNVGYWSNSDLDLIPARLELSRTLKNPTGKERRLARSLSRVSDRYDLILIDCAPTESILTDAAYFASRYVIVPVRLEFMATIGLPLLARSLQEFRMENDDHIIEIAGIIFNHADYSSGPETKKATKEVREQARKHHWHIFKNQLRHSRSYARAARSGVPISHTDNVRWYVADEFKKLKNEIFKRLSI